VKKGLGSHPLMMATRFTQVLIVFQQFRVVAVTDSAIHVFKAGWFRRHVPRRLHRSHSTTYERGSYTTSPSAFVTHRAVVDPITMRATAGAK
jgi:hypothetical protein